MHAISTHHRRRFALISRKNHTSPAIIAAIAALHSNCQSLTSKSLRRPVLAALSRFCTRRRTTTPACCDYPEVCSPLASIPLTEEKRGSSSHLSIVRSLFFFATIFNHKPAIPVLPKSVLSTQTTVNFRHNFRSKPKPPDFISTEGALICLLLTVMMLSLSRESCSSIT